MSSLSNELKLREQLKQQQAAFIKLRSILRWVQDTANCKIANCVYAVTDSAEFKRNNPNYND